MRLYILFCGLVMACSGGTSDQELIVGRRLAFNADIVDHNISKMVEYCADDIIVVTSRDTKLLGRDQYAAGLEDDFKSKEDVVYVRTPESIEVFPAWGMAAESGRWLGKWKNGAEAININGTYHAKWRKTDGQWLLVAEIFTPLNCTGGSYCMDAPK